MKKYPLDVQRLYKSDGSGVWYYSKGHHDVTMFLDAVRVRYVLQQDGGKTATEQANFVRHEWWRCVPAGPDMPGESIVVDAKEGMRGAFPVTVWGE